MKKQARVTFEDFDQCVNTLQSEFTERHETMQMILQYFEDPADQFKLRMPGEFETAKERIEEMVEVSKSAKEGYAQLLAWFKIQGMKSSEFCFMWDNLIVPGDLIINKDAKMKKDVLVPAFCQGKPISAEDLAVLGNSKSQI